MASKPNFVLIVSDDMGYSDMPLYAKSDIHTPALNRLAKSGVLFTNGYSTAPICTPSRQGIITGRNQQRFGAYCMYTQPDQFVLFREETTLPQMLKGAGYATGLVGKWHMGPRECISGDAYGHPCDHGFDEYVGIPWGMSSYQPGVDLYRGRKEKFQAPEYLTDFFGKEAVDFIQRHQEQPFFLMLAFNAVHAPLEAIDGDLDKLGGEFPGSPDRKTYAAMLEAMDRNVGRVLDALQELNLEGETWVGFINDNGGGGNNTPEHTRNTACNAPLRGFKFDLYEGGVRVPMMLRGPGLPVGMVCDDMVSGMDFAPTFLQAAGLDLPVEKPMDGVDLSPFLKGQTDAKPHDTLFWCNRVWDGPFQQQGPRNNIHNEAMRKNNWKIVRRAVPVDGEAENPWELYDLSKDIGEQHNIAPEYPELTEKLAGEFEAWRAPLPKPLEKSW
ncbi:MAG: sulfatase-like hydrolase/transferase [Candidatus Sumerlaeia bacterium]